MRGLLLLIMLTGCSHAVVREVTAIPCPPPPAIRDNATEEYFERVQSPFRKVFQKAVQDGKEKLFDEETELNITQTLKGRYSLNLAPDGSVTGFKTVCPLGVKEFDEAFSNRMRSIKQVEAPPAGIDKIVFDIDLEKN